MVESKIISIQDDDDFINLLVYGKSGAGKTVLAGSDDKVLFIAPEDDGTLSAKRRGSTASKWPINKWSDILEAYEYLYELSETGKIPFNWVVIDSLTEFQAMAMRGILDMAVENNPRRDPDIPEIQDWQKYFEMFKRMVKAFNALPVNVLYTALVRNEEDEEGEQFLTPDIQGKGYQMSQLIASYMTSYGALQVLRRRVEEDGKKSVREVRRITWRDTGIIQGKDRTGVLAPFTEDKTLKDLRLMIEGGAKPKESEKRRAPARRTPEGE